MIKKPSEPEKANKVRFLICTVFIIAGFWIYASCRRATFAYEKLFLVTTGSGWTGVKSALQRSCPNSLSHLPGHEVIIYSLPNALWCISLCLFLLGEIASLKRIGPIKRQATLGLICLTPELLQLIHAIPGYYDSTDALLAAASPIVAEIIEANLTK